MKSLRISLPIALAALTLAPLSALAQPAPDNDNAPQRPARRQFQPGQQGPGQQGRFGANLSQEERTKLFAALQKAREEASVKKAQEEATAAQKKLADATKAAVLKADPTLKDVLAKLPENYSFGTPGAAGQNFQRPATIGNGEQRQRPARGEGQQRRRGAPAEE